MFLCESVMLRVMCCMAYFVHIHRVETESIKDNNTHWITLDLRDSVGWMDTVICDHRVETRRMDSVEL